MNVAFIVIGAFGTVTEGFLKGLDGLVWFGLWGSTAHQSL